MGSCVTVLTAVDKKLLTDAQSLELAQAIGRKLQDTNPDLKLDELKRHATTANALPSRRSATGF